MPRISRQCYESTFFHVMVQGIKKEYIFYKPLFKDKYLLFLNEAASKYNIKVIAYCIMDNHAHILFFTNEIDMLTKIMECVNTRYAIFYNKIQKRCGYVFRDRYRCENIYSTAYLHNCIRYIHQNPVKAKICISAGEYKFSSYNSFLNHEVSQDIIDLVYNNDADYVANLNTEVHQNNFIDIDNEFGEDKKELAEDVLKEFPCIDAKDNQKLYIIINELLKRCDISKIEIARLLKIGKTKLYKIIKDNKVNSKTNDKNCNKMDNLK